MAQGMTAEQIREAVRERYAEAARRAKDARQGGCGCGSGGCGADADPRGFYAASELKAVPAGAALASLGCGNPTLLAQLREGETVLDLGSGGGIDVLLSARRVGPTGRAYGLDMTDEMLELARANAREAGVENVEFLKGQIESIPLPDASVDVIISNCVINLSADKDAVLREAFRVLKPGGRFAVADIVVQGSPMPPELQQLMALWAECISGALTESDYRAKLAAAGFAAPEVVVLHSYGLADVPETFRDLVPAELLETSDTRVVSAFVRATKPGPTGQPTRPARGFVPLPVVEPTGVSGQATCACGVGDGAAAACCSGATELAEQPSSDATPADAACCAGTPSSAEVRAYFDGVAGRWDELRAGYYPEEVRAAVLHRLVPHPDMRVVDIGAGTGFLAAGLAPLVAQVTCVDASAEMLAKAREHLGAYSNVRYYQSAGEALPLADGSVDGAVASMYLHHTPDPAQALREVVRVLRPGGRLVLADLDAHSEEWMRAELADVWLGFDREQLQTWLAQAGLEQVAVEDCGQSCCADRPTGGRASVGIFVASGRRPL